MHRRRYLVLEHRLNGHHKLHDGEEGRGVHIGDMLRIVNELARLAQVDRLEIVPAYTPVAPLFSDEPDSPPAPATIAV